MIFFFYSNNAMYHIYQFAYIEPCLDPRDEFHLIMVYDPFNGLLNLVCYFQIFASTFIRNIGLLVLGFFPLQCFFLF